MPIKEAVIGALHAEIVSLRARRDATKGYVANVNMQIETVILNKQIEALEEEYRTQMSRYIR